MKLLFIHGRGQGEKVAESLKPEWYGALCKGCRLAGIAAPSMDTIAMPFYGKRLDELSSRADAPLTDEIVTRGGSGIDSAYQEFRAQVFDEVRVAAGIDDAAVDAEVGEGVRGRGPANWEWVQGILRALDRHAPTVTELVLDRVTRDVWVYLTAPGVRDEIDACVASALSAEPTVVVSHSLGTVVAYSVLRRGQGYSVPKLVTLGSPLGVHAIRNRFRPLKMPAGVDDWYNAYDEADVVGLRGLDEDVFPVRPAVRNNPRVHNDTDNRHGISGYLGDPDVAREILAFA